jgi:hypothetical protein
VRSLVLAGLLAAAACGERRDDVYPAEVVRTFMDACTTRGSAAACRCTLDAIQRRFTVDEFRALEERARRGDPPREMMELATACTR